MFISGTVSQIVALLVKERRLVLRRFVLLTSSPPTFPQHLHVPNSSKYHSHIQNPLPYLSPYPLLRAYRTCKQTVDAADVPGNEVFPI